MAKPKYAAQGQLGISYLWTDEGWIYLAIVLDLSTRKVVGRSRNHAYQRTS
ncbi:MAG: hypothetical protein EWM73_02241 [Nitrospira sp.]|nr:MAG: hypothetical protein EWM73_02241 [Nitrospira sp.]